MAVISGVASWGAGVLPQRWITQKGPALEHENRYGPLGKLNNENEIKYNGSYNLIFHIYHFLIYMY